MAKEHTTIPIDYLLKNHDAILDPLDYDVENQKVNYKMEYIISKNEITQSIKEIFNHLKVFLTSR